MKTTKMFTKPIAAIALIALMGSSSAMAGECEISGLNIIRAYNRAHNNGASFACLHYNSARHKYVGTKTVQFLPLPDRLQCLHRKEKVPSYWENYRMLAFSKPGQWPLNGWKISRYRMSGNGGQKKATRSGGIIFQTQHAYQDNWNVTLTKFWLKKNGASCNDINAVITSAFGD